MTRRSTSNVLAGGFAAALLLSNGCGEPSAAEDMVWIPTTTFAMGGADPQAIEEELPVHEVTVSGFFIDATPVTNRQFRAFVKATGYVTEAETPPDRRAIEAQLPAGTELPADFHPPAGSLVFQQPSGPVDMRDWSRWWSFVPGANWRHPEGPGSNLEGLDDHPVVQVSWNDAQRYAQWAGKRLPTEAEWELAARGGLAGQPYSWGAERNPGGHWRCNIWQGRFPQENTVADGFPRTSPVRQYPANAYGLHDTAGNVWEWCQDWYHPDTYALRAGSPCHDPKGPASSHDPNEPEVPKRVTRGGSFLCNEATCIGYRTSARMKSSPDTGLNNTGFRCARSAK